MGIIEAIFNRLGITRWRGGRSVARNLSLARQATERGNRQAAIDAYCALILAHQLEQNALAAAQVAKEALDAYPGELRVLRLISRLYAAKGAHAQDQGGGLLLLAAASGEAETVPSPTKDDDDSPRIEISKDRLAVLSLFPESAFERLVAGSQAIELKPGEVLFSPGGRGGSIYLITSGAAQVLETASDGTEVEAARVSEGGVLGVFSYMTGRPRSAMVRSLTALSALEIPSDVLDYECAKNEQVSLILARFCRDRLLLNLLSTLPGYRDLSHDQKARLLGRFRLQKLDPGEELFGQNATEPFLALVVDGRVRVVKKSGSFAAEIATLAAGDCIGNVGSPPASPAKAGVFAGELGCKIAILPARATAALRATTPLITDPRSELSSPDQIIAGGIFCATAATPAALVPAAWN